MTPRDVHVLGTRKDNQPVSDALKLSVQSTASVASVSHHLIVKSHKVQVLRAKLQAQQNLVEDFQSVIRRLKKDKAKTIKDTHRQIETLQDWNKELSKMVSIYSRDMQD